MNIWPFNSKDKDHDKDISTDVVAMAEVIAKLQAECKRYKDESEHRYSVILQLRREISEKCEHGPQDYNKLPLITLPIKFRQEEDDEYVYIIADHDKGRTISFNREFDTSKGNYNWVNEGEALITLRYDNVAYNFQRPATIKSPTSGIFEFINNKLINVGEQICRIRKISPELKSSTLEEYEREDIKQSVLKKERKKMIERQTLDELIAEGLVFNVTASKNGGRQTIPSDVANAVWNRDGGRCCICGAREELEFDHIIPVSKGGATTFRNLQLLCKTCNIKKSDNI